MPWHKRGGAVWGVGVSISYYERGQKRQNLKNPDHLSLILMDRMEISEAYPTEHTHTALHAACFNRYRLTNRRRKRPWRDFTTHIPPNLSSSSWALRDGISRNCTFSMALHQPLRLHSLRKRRIPWPVRTNSFTEFHLFLNKGIPSQRRRP